MSGATPWAGMFAAALAKGVAPGDVWRLSLREWRWLAAPVPGDTPMTESRLAALLARFERQKED